MFPTVLVFGANGRSGRAIVAEAVGQGGLHVVACCRDGSRLSAPAAPESFESEVTLRVAAVDDHAGLIAAVQGVDVVVNAAGPFHTTALPLLQACLNSGCDYVDINGEIDVYLALHALAADANKTGAAVVSGAGYISTASDLLALAATAKLSTTRLSSVRVEHSGITALSGASIATAWRMLALPVIVSNERIDGEGHTGGWPATLVAEPVGKLERPVQFQSPATDGHGSPILRRGLATAVSLLDTPVLRQTFDAAGIEVATVQSYMEMPGWQRLAYQAGSLAGWFASSASAQRIAVRHLPALSAAPERLSHAVALAVDGEFDEPLLRWQLDVEDVHDFTAQAVVAVVLALTSTERRTRGWLTPAAALCSGPVQASQMLACFRGCRIHAPGSGAP